MQFSNSLLAAVIENYLKKLGGYKRDRKVFRKMIFEVRKIHIYSKRHRQKLG
ncbi:MAG TPA: hypothetical protein PK860_01400 [Paludibacteraceae bacterium]|nr:hypothetical protein [Paludibacteraceae bacterium]HOL00182.1 hypothetical protein [Paludibacteraceae bacterium]